VVILFQFTIRKLHQVLPEDWSVSYKRNPCIARSAVAEDVALSVEAQQLPSRCGNQHGVVFILGYSQL